MKTNIHKISGGLLVVLLAIIIISCKDDEENFPETRLFRPVLTNDLSAVGNTIIVDMGRLKRAVSYTIEVSRDTFKTIEYTVQSDTNYVVLDEDLLNGDPLFWNMLYQVRATAHAEDPQFDSRISDLGSVRTQRFPSILKVPASYDVTDVNARVAWTVSGAAVTHIMLYPGSDLKLTTPLVEIPVESEDQLDGDAIISDLQPETKYQVAIYSDDVLRGWVDYTTLPLDIDPSSAGVVDLRGDEDPAAVANAVAAAQDGAIILISRGSYYDLPSTSLTKSVTIRAAYGFGPKKAKLYTTGNWNIAGGSTIDHIRFIDVEIRGEDFGGNYVFNPSSSDITVGELLFENCEIGTLRGILRIRGSNVLIDNYKIVNCVVDSLGGYGILTADTDPNPDIPTARVNNIVLQNSTFNKLYSGITSRNNSQSILIEGCTFNNFVLGGSGNYMFRYRGSDGNNNVLNGITIRNTIIGPGWDEAGTGTKTVRGIQNLAATSFNVSNTFTTSDFSFADGTAIAQIPVGNYAGSAQSLWVDPDNNNFNFKDSGFIGRYTTGDPRWRVKL